MMRLITLLLALLPGAAPADDITVFAAASTKSALDEVAADYEARTGQTVVLSYAGSSALARQIGLGAPADLFLSANPGWMDYLEDLGAIISDSRRDLLGNSLVVIAHGQAEPLHLTDLPGAVGQDHVAMALVDAVPAGIYGKAALATLGLWDDLAPHVAQTDNARTALALVATGEAPFGIVYATDAAAEPRVAIVAHVPPDSHPPITYPAAAITEAGLPFLDHLASDSARAAFARHGFTVPGE